jgi:ribosomal-protein-alanine N-acetyltransferase
MKIEIRRRVYEDLDEIMEMEVKSFSTPWSRKAFENELINNMLAVYYVAVYEGKCIGYAGMWHVMDELHITNVAVHPDYRGHHIANLLMEALIAFGDSDAYVGMTLEVRVGNHVAIHLYEKYGFTKLGIRRGYYQDNGEDAMVMWKELKKNA